MSHDAAYDYVIVGAGSAGCVLANRLTEDPAVHVLLLEAGGSDARLDVRLPIAVSRLWMNQMLGWGFQSEPEAQLAGRRIPVPRGKMLGGTSSINGMMAIRGHAADYDHWRALGLKGWGFSEVLPYFRKLERHWRGADAYHGGDGPVAIRPHPAPSALLARSQAAARAMGFALTDDFNGPCTTGFGMPDFTIDERGRRASAASAYLHPARKRRNLTVALRAEARKVMIDKGRAIGVEYRQNGTLRTASAAREVILCAGAIGSPHILLLSGIGPAEHLHDHGLRVHIDRPAVGDNLQDHPGASIEFALDPAWAFDGQLRLDRLAKDLLRWAVTGKGPMAAPPVGISANVATVPNASLVDMHFLLVPLALDARVWFPGLRKPRGPTLTAMWSLNYPRSRGSVRLNSPDPHVKPSIRYHLLEDSRDRDDMIRGYRVLRELLSQPPLAEILGPMQRPIREPTTDDEVLEYVRGVAGTAFNPCGTCRMGADDDAVLDNELRVRGIAGLRVVDASVFPTLPGGNTNLPVIMVAEKAADLIRQAPPPAH